MNEKEFHKIQQILQERSHLAELNQFVISSPEKSIIGTTSLTVCDGIVFYNRNNKWGMVGHAVDGYKTDLLSEMMAHFPSDNQITLEYAIIPGYDNVANQNLNDVNELKAYLKHNCPSNIQLIPLSIDKLGVQVSEAYAYEFAFDVNTGMSVSGWLFTKEDNKKSLK